MRKIRQSGKDGEERFRQDKFLSNIERRHHGKDFVEKQTDLTGKTREISWEVKRNNSPLSPKQKNTRNLHVRRYVDTKYGVEARTEDKHGNRLEHNIISGKWEKIKKSKLNLLWNHSESRRSSDKEKNHTVFGSSRSFDSLFDFISNSKNKRTAKKNANRAFDSTSHDSFW